MIVTNPLKSLSLLASLLLMAGGSFVPDKFFTVFDNWIIFGVIVLNQSFFLIYFSIFKKKHILFDVAILSLALIFFLPFAIGENFRYGAEKIFLAFCIPTACMAVLSFFKWNEEDVTNGILYSVLIICAIALFDKFDANLYSRSGRFGLLGPITFGWLCAFAAVICFFNVIHKWHLGRVLLLSLFLSGVIWSGSKGPFIGLLIVIGIILTNSLHKGQISRTVSLNIFIYLGLAALALYLVGQNSRILQTGEDLANDPAAYVDGGGAGSIGSRLGFLDASLDVFQKDPIMGVGLGAWSDATHIYFARYPHNIFVEVLVEAGLVGGAFILILILYILRSAYKLVPVFGWVALCGLIVLNFSGDLGYLRYPLYFSLLAKIVGRPLRCQS